jgi:hypothetical protein
MSPFKIFIKFQFSPKYGYSFIGLFRKPQTFLLDEHETIRLKKTYHLILNDKGKILELSPSCHSLLRITPQILDALHNSLPENLKLSFFNPNL